MKVKILSAVMATLSISAMTMPAHAVYNIYKKNGLSLDINGEVNVNFSNDREQFTVQQDTQTNINNAWYDFVAGTYQERTDRRTRLGQDSGASWLDVRGSQLLPNDWRVTGTIGFGYWDSGTGMYLNNANLAFDKKNQGAISFGRQYLHTGYVTRTGTYTPLETFGETSVRVDYTGIKGLHTSAFYSFPASSDIRTPNNTAEVEGFGASASYTYPIADNQSLRVAAGYTNSRFNPNTSSWWNGNQYPIDTKAMAASLEYRVGDFLVAADYGKQDLGLDGAVIDSSEADILGVKVGYEFTPRFSMTAGHGTKKTERTKVAGERLAINNTDCAGTCTTLVDIYQPFMFDKVEEERTYVRADYHLRDNVRLYGRVDLSENQLVQAGTNVAKVENTEYRAGISFSF